MSTENADLQDVQDAQPSLSTRKHSRKRKISESDSSSSESSSSSSCSDSSCSKRSRRRKTKSKRRRRNQNRKFDKMMLEIKNLKNQIACNNNINDDIIDDNISGQLYSDVQSLDEEPAPQISLTIGTRLKEPEILKTPAVYLDTLKNIQRLEHPDWRNVRYADVQKLFIYLFIYLFIGTQYRELTIHEQYYI
ncbi:hypothetical protein JYU34_017687 [Plutella xylostella]|uniref:Uncharacterized protein n=1 Tax=Plutella xylostella TaxID=51655 RepID=A0ABQ7Q1Q9_PLUXY|nr:hypothetical protein JYU34_017687 [Plutella xylostella]